MSNYQSLGKRVPWHVRVFELYDGSAWGGVQPQPPPLQHSAAKRTTNGALSHIIFHCLL